MCQAASYKSCKEYNEVEAKKQTEVEENDFLAPNTVSKVI